MANVHSSVNYIEPNLSASGLFKVTNESGGTSWKVDDNYERAPRLEDYSIYFNLEVEICGRENISANKKITSDVLILSYRQNLNTSAETVNFMGGTKVKPSNEGYNPMQYLTTNYADMYVGDLYDYGTTEMIGVKSVDIEYQASCVPVVTVNFTDVRGISLFQPTELSRANSYQGIGGINADNVAQSFFQCFFRVPMPRFTMTIKGFYGKPVTYECLCDKFDTKFNSSTGDFDITTRFIGYSYSFLTDISIDALLAAPYSDFGGGLVGNYNKYWAEKKESGEFYVYNKEKTEKDEMPTLFEIWDTMQDIFSKPTADVSGVVAENISHEEEIEELKAILNLYNTWYEKFFEICVNRYGKDYCFLFKKSVKDEYYYRILILTKESNGNSFGVEYEQFPDDFKEINKNLYAMIAKYNENESHFKKLENVSLDYAEIKPLLLFRPMYLNPKGRVIFNGFDVGNKIPETQVVNNVFYGVDYSEESQTAEEIKTKEANHKRHVLETIYDDGTDQYIRCYSIDNDYSSVKNRIDYLQAEANKSDEDKNIEARRKSLNKQLIEQMKWYPSIENFTRIMMAHFETLMKQMYDVATQCEGRTASELGVTTGPDGTCIDVNAAKDVIPPFPRVTKRILGDDGITKIEDTWVGEYNHGEKPFVEVDFIDGLLNGVEKISALRKDRFATNEEQERQVEGESEAYGGVVKHPLSTFDFYITSTPYGDQNELSNDQKGYDFMGKVCMRMFDILCVGQMLDYKDRLKDIATVEAINFHEQIKITNPTLQTLIRNKELTGERIINEVTTANADHPWGNRILFTKDMWLDGYKVKGGENWIYPIQNTNYKKLEEYVNAFNGGNVINGEGNISIWTLPSTFKYSDKFNTDSAYGNAFIIESDKIADFEEKITNANDGCGDAYNSIYETITRITKFDEEKYYLWFVLSDITPSVSRCILEGQKINDNTKIKTVRDGNGTLKINDKFYKYLEEGDSIGSDAKGGDTSNYTITEVFAITKDKAMRINSSFLVNKTLNVISENIRDVKNYGSSLAILGIKTNNNTNFLNKQFTSKVFVYAPKLVLLQLGAICNISDGDSADDIEARFKKIGFGNVRDLHGDKIEVVATLSKQVRYYLKKYFITWSENHKDFISDKGFLGNEKCYLKQKVGDTNRRILDENNQTVKRYVKELLTPVLYVRLSVNAINGRRRTNYILGSGNAETYLDAFIEKLKQFYQIDYKEDSEGNVIKTVDEPKHTSEDIKIELYRYMKQVYDKWIPMSSFDEWKLETFFQREQGEERGHTFYFIDSYYNDIGSKLLINPRNLMEKIDALLNYSDVNAMMLGFMADVYASNRCMMKCIQNFFDLTSEGSMTEMFMPMPFNSINWSKEVNKYPSFVVVYPYEPSKNLNVPNNEYNDDSFMLNDENETPQPIRSKTNDKSHYRIPAFGVSYGKQYQSYFKSVNINMQSPVATQQAIQAKHYILREAANPKRSPGITGQDLYDIYATQSYTCDVEMMGCAWVQPMMYFVLLNVPMFRGSYLIMKVKHSIRPGDMTTTFTGCRMANVSNKLIEDIFTDDFIADDNIGGGNGTVDNREMKANIDNDCPYKIFPLYESNTLDGTLTEKGVQMMEKLMSRGMTDIAAAGVAGNMAQECKFDHLACVIDSDNYLAGGLCGWNDHYGNLTNLCENNYNHFGQEPIKRKFTTNDNGIKKAKEELARVGINGQVDFLMNTLDKVTESSKSKSKFSLSKLNQSKSPEGAAKKFLDAYERGSMGDRLKYAKDIYDEFKKGGNRKDSSQPSNKDPNDKKDINEAFFEAVNKSAQATPSIGVELIKKVIDNKETKKTYYSIFQKNGNTDKLPLVFDMILNSEYFYCIQELYWVYPSGGTSVNPIHIDYIASENPDAKNKFVRIAETKIVKSTEGRNIPSDANENLLRALAKYRAKKGDKYLQKDVPQMKDLSILDKYKPENCDSLFSSGSNPSGPGDNSSWAKAVQSMGKWYEANIHTYGHTEKYECPLIGVKVRDDCSGYVSACLQYFGVFKKGFNPRSGQFAFGENVASILKSKGFTRLDYSWSAVQPYDIIAYDGHVEVLAQKGNAPRAWGWGNVHDCRNGHGCMPYGTGSLPKGSTYKTIWRYVG